MEKDEKPFVWLDMTVLGKEEILGHFPHIYERCLEEGYDAVKEWIPVVPAQHYFMGGTMSIKTVKQRWISCMQLVKQAATVCTAQIVLQAILF